MSYPLLDGPDLQASQYSGLKGKTPQAQNAQLPLPQETKLVKGPPKSHTCTLLPFLFHSSETGAT